MAHSLEGSANGNMLLTFLLKLGFWVPNHVPLLWSKTLSCQMIQAPLVDGSQYRRLIGRLLYLTITQPDIMYSVHILSQFIQDPHQGHWDAAICILRY